MPSPFANCAGLETLSADLHCHAAGGEVCLTTRRTPLAEHLHSALLEHERVVSELRGDNELLRGQLWRLSGITEAHGVDAGGLRNCRGPSLETESVFSPTVAPDIFSKLYVDPSFARSGDVADVVEHPPRSVDSRRLKHIPITPRTPPWHQDSCEDSQRCRQVGRSEHGQDVHHADHADHVHHAHSGHHPHHGTLHLLDGEDPAADTEQPAVLADLERTPSDKGDRGTQVTFAEEAKLDRETSTAKIMNSCRVRPSSKARGSFTLTGSKMLDDGQFMTFMKTHFETFTSLIIVLNTIFLFVQLQQAGKVIGGRQGFGDAGFWPSLNDALYFVEHSFNAVFVLELLARLVAWKGRYFISSKCRIEWSNMFDFSLVLSSSLDLYVIQPLGDALNLSMFRPLRFFRLLRTLRILQLFRSLLPLRILVKAVASSFLALFWSISLLLLIMVMAALFLCQMLSNAVEDESIDVATRNWIYTMYGTSPRAYWTVFELTFSGGWPNYVRTLVEEVSPLYAFFFHIYVVAVIFAMFRIVSALFLKDTLAAAAADAEVAIVEKQKQKKTYAQKMMTFFRAANASGNGYLTREEFNSMMEDPEVQTWFSVMDLDVHESSEFFELLASSDGRVSAEDFVTAVPRLKGQARAQDVVAVRVQSKRIQQSLEDIRGQLRESQAMSACQE